MNHIDIWGAIDAFARARGMTCSHLARLGGMDPTTFNRSKRISPSGQPRWPSTQSIAKILSATDSSFSDFAKYVKDAK